MAYSTTTINSATPAVGLMDWLDTEILAAGWTDVETWTSSTKTANVYKSPAASNDAGVDFYVTIYRASTTDTSIKVMIHEAYDAVNHKLQKYAPAAGTGITVNVADNTVTDATGVLPDSATPRGILVNFALSTSIVYWLTVDIDHIVLGSNYAVGVVYAGIADSLLTSAADPVCLVVTGNRANGEGAGAASFTREPGAPAAAAGNFLGLLPFTGTSYNYAYAPYTQTALVAADTYTANPSALLWLQSQRTNTGARCVLRTMVTCRAGGVLGDTLTVTQKAGGTKTYALASIAAASAAQIYVPNA